MVTVWVEVKGETLEILWMEQLVFTSLHSLPVCYPSAVVAPNVYKHKSS